MSAELNSNARRLGDFEARRADAEALRVAGPRLRAAIGTFQGFMPTAFWLARPDSHDSMLPTYLDEVDAIERGDAERARDVVMRRAASMAETVIDELFRRGVFGLAGVDRGRAEAASGPRVGKGR